MVEKLKVTLAKSLIGAILEQKTTTKALGLIKMYKTIEVSDNSTVRGMVTAARHLVRAEEV